MSCSASAGSRRAREESAARWIEAVARVAAAVVHELSLHSVVDVMLEQSVNTLGARFAYVHRSDERVRELRLLGHRNVPEDLAAAMMRMSYDGPLLAARATTSRRLQLASREGADHEIDRQTLARAGCETLAALPLVARGQLVGVMSFAPPHGADFDPDEGDALTTCAEIFAFAIFNAALYEEERRLHGVFEGVGRAAMSVARQYELTPALQDIVDEARAITGAELAALGIVRGPEQPFEPWVYSGVTREQAAVVGTPPRPVGVLGAVGIEGTAVNTTDLRGHPAFRGLPANHPPIESFLGVPVRHQGRVVGNLCVANRRDSAQFATEDEQTLDLLAAHAGAALYQSRLREDVDRERRRFQAIVENAPHGVVFIDAATSKVVANRRAMEIAGATLPPDTVLARDWLGAACTPEGKVMPEEQWPSSRALHGEGVVTQEMLLRRRDGAEVPVLMSAARIAAENGNPDGVVVVYEDISAMKQLQRMREEWSSLIAHELRQPLNVVLGYANIVLRRTDVVAQPIRGELDHIRRAAERLNRMIGDLLDASRIDADKLSLQPRPVDLCSLASEVVERYRATAPDRGIALEAATVPRVWADPVRVEQILDNLVTNALKYSGALGGVELRVRAAGPDVEVLVANAGPGIAPEHLPRIFERHYRVPGTHVQGDGGLGLGLYIAKSLVEAQGGRIAAESRPGGTTTFRFALPALHDA